MDTAAAGVRRLLAHAEAAIPTPPLPSEALRLDGWPHDAVEVLSVVSRRAGGAPQLISWPALEALGVARIQPCCAPLPAAALAGCMAAEGPKSLTTADCGVSGCAQGPPTVLSRPSGASSLPPTPTAAAAEGGEPAAKRRRVQPEGAAEWEQLWARLAAECQAVEAAVGNVAISPGADPEPGGALLVTCEWRGPGSPGSPAAGAGGASLPDWRQLRLRVGPRYPAEPPVPIFPGQLQPAGPAAARAEAVKDRLGAVLLVLSGPPSLNALVAAWAHAVRAVSAGGA